MTEPKPNEKLLSVIKDGIAVFTINNASKRNAMSKDMWEAMGDIFASWATDPEVRVIIIRGEGEKCFCAGNDISEFSAVRNSRESIADYNRVTMRAYDKLKNIPKPTIARIEGFCIGGGLEIAMLCDLQFAAATSTFAITPAKLGLGYNVHDICLLLENVSPKIARELLFTGGKFSAEDAMRWGLINRAVPTQTLDEVVESYAAEIAANAPLSVKAAKLNIHEALKTPPERDYDLCRALVDACHDSADYQEGQRAFAEKRKPEFCGK